MSLRPFTPEGGRQSPFKRQNSTASTGSARASTPTPTSPTKASTLTPNRSGSLSPEKASPFVRRPSQIGHTLDRPASPLARASSRLSVSTTGSRQDDVADKENETLSGPLRQALMTPSFGAGSGSEALKSPSPFDGPAIDSPSVPIATHKQHQSPAQRSRGASSTTSTIRPPTFMQPVSAPKPMHAHPAGYSHISGPLLRSMRESFEVLDSSNTGSVTSASVASMLEQMGLPNTPSDVREFFSPTGPSQLNLARYLDILGGPLADMSQSEELAAAFSAFDVDDSGQIDLAELRNALLNTAPERGEAMIKLSEKEVDGILGEFTARRAFGAKGVNVAKSKGEVFRWRDFMGSITGGADGQGEVAVA